MGKLNQNIAKKYIEAVYRQLPWRSGMSPAIAENYVYNLLVSVPSYGDMEGMDVVLVLLMLTGAHLGQRSSRAFRDLLGTKEPQFSFWA